MIKVHAMGIGPPIASLRERVRRLEESGVDGVFAGDHLFVSRGKRRSEAIGGGEPFGRLAAVGTLSERLMIGTSVVNIGFAHPALALRSFVELANLFGGSRIVAGIGAGWNPEEFDALGLEFPPFARRMDRLEEAAQLARTLFDEAFADLAGEHIVTRALPMGPQLSPPPRLLLGGGSDRLLKIAGRYADIVDLNGSSRRVKLGGPQPFQNDQIRRLTTTIADLEDSVRRVRETAAEAGRDPDRLEFSIVVSGLRFCAESEVEAVEAEICRQVGIDPMPFGDCPYVFVGTPERMREQLTERAERIRLRHLIVGSVGYEEMARFRRDVVAPIRTTV